MGLENRNGRLYFYEKQRIGKKVISHYVCKGADAELLSRISNLKQDRAETERDYHRWMRERDSEEEQELKSIGKAVDVLLAEFYTTHGYHNHKGEWRHGRKQKD